MNSENTENIDIVNLVENNPIEKINETKYQYILIEKLQSNFINSEELLFLQNYQIPVHKNTKYITLSG